MAQIIPSSNRVGERVAHCATKYFDNNFETKSKFLGTQVIKCLVEMKLDENNKL